MYVFGASAGVHAALWNGEDEVVVSVASRTACDLEPTTNKEVTWPQNVVSRVKIRDVVGFA